MAPIAADLAPLFVRTASNRTMRPARLLQSTALVLVLAASPAVAQVVWEGNGTGPGNTNATHWDNGDNWDGSAEPTAADDVEIGAETNDPEVRAGDTDAEANTVTLQTGGDLTVNGDLAVTSTIALQDDGVTGSALTIGGTGEVNAGGTVSVSGLSQITNNGTLTADVNNSGTVINTPAATRGT